MKKDKPPARCLSAGSAMVDIIATIADRDVERMTLHNATLSFLLVEQGRKIEAESISTSVGGGGVNVAVSLSRLGSPVDVLIKLGADVDAERVRAHIAAAEIGTSHITVSNDLPTGSAVLIASHDKDAAIYTQRGANTGLTTRDFANVDFKTYGLVYLAPLSGASAECMKPLVAKAAKAGAFVAVNPGIRQITTRSPDLLNALSGIDLLALNAKEAAALAPALMAFADETPAATRVPARSSKSKADGNGRALLAEGLRLNDGSFSLIWFFKTLSQCGAKHVAVTNGRDGSYLYAAGEVWHCPIRDVAVMGTAGAGDAFSSTLAHGLANGLTAEAALVRAAVNAASVVGFAEAQMGLLDAKGLAKEASLAALKVWRGKV